MTTQRLRVVVALAAATAALCLLLHAPWTHRGGSEPIETRYAGRASVFGDGPSPANSRVGGAQWGYTIATAELAVELAAILGVAGILLLVISPSRDDRAP